MKLKSREDIKSIAWDGCLKFIGHREHKGEWSIYGPAYREGYNQAQQDLIESASEGFDQFFTENFSVNEIGELQYFTKTMSGARNIGVNNYSLEKVWQEAKLSSVKEINRLRKEKEELVEALYKMSLERDTIKAMYREEMDKNETEN